MTDPLVEELSAAETVETESQKRLNQWRYKLEELQRALDWVELHLDDFTEIPMIDFRAGGSGASVSFGHLTYGGRMMHCIHHVFKGKTATRRLSGSVWHFELIDAESGIEFCWYVFKEESSSQSKSEVIL